MSSRGGSPAFFNSLTRSQTEECNRKAYILLHGGSSPNYGDNANHELLSVFNANDSSIRNTTTSPVSSALIGSSDDHTYQTASLIGRTRPPQHGSPAHGHRNQTLSQPQSTLVEPLRHSRSSEADQLRHLLETYKTENSRLQAENYSFSQHFARYPTTHGGLDGQGFFQQYSSVHTEIVQLRAQVDHLSSHLQTKRQELEAARLEHMTVMQERGVVHEEMRRQEAEITKVTREAEEWKVKVRETEAREKKMKADYEEEISHLRSEIENLQTSSTSDSSHRHSEDQERNRETEQQNALEDLRQKVALSEKDTYRLSQERDTLRLLCDRMRQERSEADTKLADHMRELDRMRADLLQLAEIKEKLVKLQKSQRSCLAGDVLATSPRYYKTQLEVSLLSLVNIDFRCGGEESGLVVTRISDTSEAGAKLRPGDEITAINHASIIGITTSQAQELFQTSTPGPTILQVSRIFTAGHFIEAKIPLHGANLMGAISFETEYFVSNVKGPAKESLLIGDRILSINGISVSGKPKTDVQLLLSDCQDIVTWRFSSARPTHISGAHPSQSPNISEALTTSTHPEPVHVEPRMSMSMPPEILLGALGGESSLLLEKNTFKKKAKSRKSATNIPDSMISPPAMEADEAEAISELDSVLGQFAGTLSPATQKGTSATVRYGKDRQRNNHHYPGNIAHLTASMFSEAPPTNSQIDAQLRASKYATVHAGSRTIDPSLLHQLSQQSPSYFCRLPLDHATYNRITYLPQDRPAGHYTITHTSRYYPQRQDGHQARKRTQLPGFYPQRRELRENARRSCPPVESEDQVIELMPAVMSHSMMAEGPSRGDTAPPLPPRTSYSSTGVGENEGRHQGGTAQRQRERTPQDGTQLPGNLSFPYSMTSSYPVTGDSRRLPLDTPSHTLPDVATSHTPTSPDHTRPDPQCISADHTREDHTASSSQFSGFNVGHTRSLTEHSISMPDHSRSSDHTRSTPDHTRSTPDHSRSTPDHSRSPDYMLVSPTRSIHEDSRTPSYPITSQSSTRIPSQSSADRTNNNTENDDEDADESWSQQGTLQFTTSNLYEKRQPIAIEFHNENQLKVQEAGNHRNRFTFTELQTSYVSNSPLTSDQSRPNSSSSLKSVPSDGPHKVPKVGVSRLIKLDRNRLQPGLELLWSRSGEVFVRRVEMGSPASTAGLVEGDQIIMVGNRSTSELSTDETNEAIFGSEMTSSQLSIKVQFNPHKLRDPESESDSCEDLWLDQLSVTGVSSPHIPSSPPPAPLPSPPPPEVVSHSETPTNSPRGSFARRGGGRIAIAMRRSNSGRTSKRKVLGVSTSPGGALDVMEEEGEGEMGTERWVTVARKNASDSLGVTLTGGNAVGIFVLEVAQHSVCNGVLRAGDHIMECNGINFRAMIGELAVREINKPSLEVLLLVKYEPQNLTKIIAAPFGQDSFYIRSLFNFSKTSNCLLSTSSPEDNFIGSSSSTDDPAITEIRFEPEYHLPFDKDDLLLVDASILPTATSPRQPCIHWHAWTIDRSGRKLKHGLIPSRHRLERLGLLKLLVPAPIPPLSTSQPLSSSPSPVTRSSSWGTSSTSVVRQDSLTRKLVRRIAGKYPGGTVTSSTGTGSSGGSGDGQMLVSSQVLADCIYGYARLHPAKVSSPRPILLIGPMNQALSLKTVHRDPRRFGLPVPQSLPSSLPSSLSPSHSRTGKNTPLTQTLSGDCLEIFKRGDSTEGITIQAVKDIINSSRHCLLTIPPSALERLYQVKIYPIVILIRYKSAKQIKEVREADLCPEKISTKQAKEMMAHTSSIEHDNAYLINATIQGGKFNFMCDQIISVVEKEQNNTVWITQESFQ